MIQIARKQFTVLLLIFAALCAAALAQNDGSVVRLDSALDAIVPPNVKVEKVAGNFQHLEGPVWVRKSGYLLFSDLDAGSIYKWSAKEEKASVFLEHAQSNGITVDSQGRVVYCARGDRRIVRVEKDSRHTVLASEYEGKPLNTPNDLIYKSDGALYFTDPTDGNPKSDNESHVFLLKGGKLQLLSTNQIVHPNGLAFSPGEKVLYIIDSREKKKIFRFDVQPNDGIANGQLFVDMTTVEGAGGPDGMKVDQKGNVYAPGPGGLWIISPEGKHLGTISIPESFANLAFGDSDGKSLFLAGRTSVYRIRLKVPGIRP